MLGIGIIFTAILLGGSLNIQTQLVIALLGVLLMEAGVWGLSSKVFPSERRYIDLRAEGDNIIQLIRELNAAAVTRGNDANDDSFQGILEEMQNSVKRIAEKASREADSRTSTN
jgi:hypothetical protein